MAPSCMSLRSRDAWKAVAILSIIYHALCLGGVSALVEHTQTFRASGFTLGPGDVVNNYFQLDMPEGHVALRGLVAQIVDAEGTSIPLTETYVHHWVMLRYYVDENSPGAGLDSYLVQNDGICHSGALDQWFGLGSETRHTESIFPAPYGIVVGDPEKLPEGSKEAWVLNLHAIDTRGVANRVGCVECWCDLYNVTIDGYGHKIPDWYTGGLNCCYDRTHCPLKEDGVGGERRELFLEYTVTWAEMDEEVIPLRVYIMDVTDTRTTQNGPGACRVEYTVPKCEPGAIECIHTRKAVAYLPEGGYVVYSVAHQHAPGMGTAIHGEDGRLISESFPIYGNGKEAGNEDGYIVGMTANYPKPGSLYIEAGEKLHLTSWYNNEERHEGVMALYLVLLADKIAEPVSPPEKSSLYLKLGLGGVVLIAAIAIVTVSLIRYFKIRKDKHAYDALPYAEVPPIQGNA